MNLNQFKKEIAVATESGIDIARKNFVHYLMDRKYLLAGINALVVEDGASLQTVFTAMERVGDTTHMSMLLNEVCRKNHDLGEALVIFVEGFGRDSNIKIYEVVFNAIYNSGMTKNRPTFVDEQIRWFADQGMTGYAGKLLKRFIVNSHRRCNELEIYVDSKKIKSRAKK